MSTIVSTKLRTTAPWTTRRSSCTAVFGWFLLMLLLSYLWCSEALAYTFLSFIWYVTLDSLSHTVTHSLSCVTTRIHALQWFRQGSRNLIAFTNWIEKTKQNWCISLRRRFGEVVVALACSRLLIGWDFIISWLYWKQPRVWAWSSHFWWPLEVTHFSDSGKVAEIS